MAFSLDSLNDAQRMAASYTGDKHCLILAGAGSGKTRVLTHRIAWLIDQGVPAWAILAITFTNKAAREMRERAQQLLPERTNGLELATFHAFGARFLRKYAHYVGLEPSFSIYAETEQKNLIKQIMIELGIIGSGKDDKEDGKEEAKQKTALVNSYMEQIMSWKEKGILADEAKAKARRAEEEGIARVYAYYERQLFENNAVDFAGLLLWPLQILRSFHDVAERIHSRYQHILVDEFQDTNKVQLQLLMVLRGRDTKLTVVGDDDQSIYKWRGADPTAILGFDMLFGDCQSFKLEQNYRSTRPILTCASNLIACNEKRTEKRLWTDMKGGEPVHVVSYPNDWEEASGVIAKISSLRERLRLEWRDFAILYRKNSASAGFERKCTQKGIPYQVVGSVGFFEREEIVDLMCYLRILVNPADRMAMRRIINKPVRGIGEKTCEKIIELVDVKIRMGVDRRNCLISLLEDIVTGKCKIPRAGTKVLNGCEMLLDVLRRVEDWEDRNPSDVLDTIVRSTHYMDYLKAAASKKGQEFYEAEDRVKSLFQMIEIYQETNPKDLSGFIEEMTLVRPDMDDSKSAVNLMTIHSAKGLEFHTVFIVGVEDKVLPLERSGECDLEEERRLMYVAMTRAKKTVYVSWAKERHEYGRICSQRPSQFLDEMKRLEDADCIDYQDVMYSEPYHKESGHGNARLAWMSLQNKPKKQESLKKDNLYLDDLNQNYGLKRKKTSQDDDFVPDDIYEDDYTDIYDDISRDKHRSDKSSKSLRQTVGMRSNEHDDAHVNPINISSVSDHAVGKNGKTMKIGSIVEHNVHKKGVVIRIEKTGSESKAVVRFASVGERTIICRFLDVVK